MNSNVKFIEYALDDERLNICPSDVERYISDIEKKMEDPPKPFILINFDETRFGKRLDKGKHYILLPYMKKISMTYPHLI